MVKKQIDKEIKLLLTAINESMLEKKAENILILNLNKIENAISNYFIICSGNSDIHVNTIAQYIEHNVKNIIKEKPWKKEGYENCEWVLLDYINIVVHVFQPKAREFYRLEQLWADAETILINN